MTAAKALLFDMDGTMVDSMPAHARSWEAFSRRHGLALPVEEILRRTTGRNGVECIRELFAREFREVAGFRAFTELALQRMRPSASRRRAAPACAPSPSAPPTRQKNSRGRT